MAKTLTAAVLTILGVAMLFCFFRVPDTRRVVESSAQAWVWVPIGQQMTFSERLRTYALSKRFKYEAPEQSPAMWELGSVALITPEGSRISVVRTGPDKFNSAMLVPDASNHWEEQWASFREFFRAQYRWQDVP
jgi:hypothetical protein